MVALEGFCSVEFVRKPCSQQMKLFQNMYVCEDGHYMFKFVNYVYFSSELCMWTFLFRFSSCFGAYSSRKWFTTNWSEQLVGFKTKSTQLYYPAKRCCFFCLCHLTWGQIIFLCKFYCRWTLIFHPKRIGCTSQASKRSQKDFKKLCFCTLYNVQESEMNSQSAQKIK